MKPGQRVRVTGIPYERQSGVVTQVDPDHSKTCWAVWVRLDGMNRPVGFEMNEVFAIGGPVSANGKATDAT